MDLTKFSTNYYNPFPHKHTHSHTHTHTHTNWAREGKKNSYINLLASDQGCKKQNTFTVSYNYVKKLLHIYVATFSPISDTFSSLSSIIEKRFMPISCQHCL